MIALRGHVIACTPHRTVARLRGARLGDIVRAGEMEACVIGLDGERVVLAPCGDGRSVKPRDPVLLEEGAANRRLGIALLGKALEGRAVAMPPAPSPGQRLPLREPLWTGIRTIDGLLSFVRGMRVGIFGPPGSGKSQLLAAIARGIDADAVVIALVGERGTEARHHVVAPDARTTVVCAPSSHSAGERLAAGDLAMAQAVALRERGLDVAVVFDSLARYVEAAREIAQGCGESLGRGGYPPSVWPRLANLCELAGVTARGSVTLIATVLSDAGDAADPLSEAARSYLDGHVVLSRRRADRGAFPAVDVPASLSRPMAAAVEPAHRDAAERVREALARLEDSREARELGLGGGDALLGRAVAAEGELETFLRQGPEPVKISHTLSELARIADIL